MLRRLKTDPAVIRDLPEKWESKEYCNLSEEQASLYEVVVREAMEDLPQSEGIERKGLVLSMLTRLKQVCNHPAQFLHEGSKADAGIERSGKLLRLLELLEETLSVGDGSLIFTQYKEMGSLLEVMLTERFGVGVQFLHGGTPARKRAEMVSRFQEDDGPLLFILSLKAGGTGLNLTRANHVFHFDRWWNPAVEDQATDRAFRIGQRRNVQVHKFVCAGTLEENIDRMIEQKKALAESVVGSGEGWITEFPTMTCAIWSLCAGRRTDELLRLVSREPAHPDRPGTQGPQPARRLRQELVGGALDRKPRTTHGRGPFAAGQALRPPGTGPLARGTRWRRCGRSSGFAQETLPGKDRPRTPRRRRVGARHRRPRRSRALRRPAPLRRDARRHRRGVLGRPMRVSSPNAGASFEPNAPAPTPRGSANTPPPSTTSSANASTKILLLFRLRGRAADEVLQALRERRGETGGPSPEPAAPPLEEEIAASGKRDRSLTRSGSP